MKALQIQKTGSLDDLAIREVPQPVPQPGEVLVRVEAAGINPSDVGVALGRFPQTTLPRILGRDFAGQIVDGPRDLIGSSVWGSGGGELGLTRDGAHAEFVVLPADAVAPRAQHLSAEQAAVMGVPFVTAWSALVEVAGLRAGEWAIVSGAAGAVGSAALQTARALGAKTIAYVRNDDEAAIAATFAPDAVVRSESEDLAAAVRGVTNGGMAQVALNGVGAPVFAPLFASLASRGRMVVYSMLGGKDVTLDLFALYRGDFRIFGLDTAKLTLRDIAGILRKLDPLIDARALEPPEIAERYPLSRAPEAYRRVSAGGAGKIVIVPG